jgi:2-C-methyl-D-erythritol 4-phosphate cytidylyltransferase
MSENKYAVIVAGGKGMRMGSTVPKQFLPLLGKPLLCFAIQAFDKAFPGITQVLVLPPDQMHTAQTVLRSYLSDIDVIITEGGETRYHSVQNGLAKVKDDGVVFVHDGVRPVISTEFILRCYQHALEHGSAIPIMPVTESIRSVEGGRSLPVDREHLRIIQTPQTFRTEVILPAFTQEYNAAFTDEATVVEAYGKEVSLMEGMSGNIKVTTPDDLIIAETLLKRLK